MHLGFHKSNSVIGKSIKWFSGHGYKYKYSHVSIWLNDGRVFESREFKGVRSIKADDRSNWMRDQNIDVFEIPNWLLKNYEEAVKWLEKQEGKDYDYTSVFRFISRRQASRTSSGKWFCSELAFAFIQQCGLNLLERIEPWAVDPNKLILSPFLKPVFSQDLYFLWPLKP
jgi:uncharacterized protein YycO